MTPAGLKRTSRSANSEVEKNIPKPKFNFVISLFVFIGCFTTLGKQCLFPFTYRNVSDVAVETNLTYNRCTTMDIFRPWCPTGTNEFRPQILK